MKFWNENGYIILKKAFSENRVEEINNLIDELWHERTQIKDLPLMIDVFLETPDRELMKLADTSNDARKHNYKLYDLFLEYQTVRNFVLDEVLAGPLAILLGGHPLVCNTINFEWGSEQDYHFDTFYMAPPKENKLVATWIALEDIGDDAGPLLSLIHI